MGTGTYKEDKVEARISDTSGDLSSVSEAQRIEDYNIEKYGEGTDPIPKDGVYET